MGTSRSSWRSGRNELGATSSTCSNPLLSPFTDAAEVRCVASSLSMIPESSSVAQFAS